MTTLLPLLLLKYMILKTTGESQQMCLITGGMGIMEVEDFMVADGGDLSMAQLIW